MGYSITCVPFFVITVLKYSFKYPVNINLLFSPFSILLYLNTLVDVFVYSGLDRNFRQFLRRLLPCINISTNTFSSGDVVEQDDIPMLVVAEPTITQT